ncbi:hypothetical protein HK414_22165 [Ramlibacter terrae]|uniref:Tripartite tricarboxylate transporter substrate binding protein n=1 Tax=Ramlibacter terrae TaxID=2732511 RepID=A0ABX6P519_9BURK|nr:hypothetical protein HK414_22165 [Ramlibacter terrae]
MALRRAVHSDGFEAHARRAGNAVARMDAADYKGWLQRDFERWGKVIRDAGIVAN